VKFKQKMWSGNFSSLEISIFFSLSKIYFAKVPKLPKEFYVYNLYQFNHYAISGITEMARGTATVVQCRDISTTVLL